MGHHLTERGAFKSDKYAWCPEGFFALKLTDPVAQRAIGIYAILTKDQELADDLLAAVREAKTSGGREISPPPTTGDPDG